MTNTDKHWFVGVWPTLRKYETGYSSILALYFNGNKSFLYEKLQTLPWYLSGDLKVRV